MLCIYCNEREADGREHHLPQCLGRFDNYEPLLDRLCETCNNKIGGELDREFCRNSPEAVLRSIHWIKGQKRGGKNKRPPHIYQPEKVGGRHLYIFGLDTEGCNILWQTGEQPGTLKEISQVIILDAHDNAVEHIPIPTDIKTSSELVEMFKQRGVTFMEKVKIIAASGDEERVHGLFSEIKPDLPIMQRRKGGPVPQQYFTGETTPMYFRALAKIGFHYALRYIRTITGNEGAFRALRDFIRYGTGDASHFLSSCDPVAKHDGPTGHVLTAIAATHNPIVVNMQFFCGCKITLRQWRLVLGDNPTALFLEQPQVSSHFFTYTERNEYQLVGGEVVAMTPQFHKG